MKIGMKIISKTIKSKRSISFVIYLIQDYLYIGELTNILAQRQTHEMAVAGVLQREKSLAASIFQRLQRLFYTGVIFQRISTLNCSITFMLHYWMHYVKIMIVISEMQSSNAMGQVMVLLCTVMALQAIDLHTHFRCNNRNVYQIIVYLDYYIIYYSFICKCAVNGSVVRVFSAFILFLQSNDIRFVFIIKIYKSYLIIFFYLNKHYTEFK